MAKRMKANSDMKIKLILARTNYDNNNMWTEIKTVEVEVPIDKQVQCKDAFPWQVIGAEWPEESEE